MTTESRHTRCGHESKCWACTITKETYSRYGRHISNWEAYERAVEAIEATVGPFRVPDVWHAAGGGPTLHNAMRNAIRDMRLHGLVRCIETASNPARCLTWIVER